MLEVLRLQRHGTSVTGLRDLGAEHGIDQRALTGSGLAEDRQVELPEVFQGGLVRLLEVADDVRDVSVLARSLPCAHQVLP
jgi:hypothetical protein